MMTELEEKLAQPDAASLRIAITQRLDELAARARLRLAGGMPPADYMLWQSSAEAIQAAKEVIERWPTTQHRDDSTNAALPQGCTPPMTGRS